jgi:hypothetical protein
MGTNGLIYPTSGADLLPGNWTSGILSFLAEFHYQKGNSAGKVGKHPQAIMFESAVEGAAEADVKAFPRFPQCRRGPVKIADS